MKASRAGGRWLTSYGNLVDAVVIFESAAR